MNGNNISANTILLGWYTDEAVTLNRGTMPGSLTASNLYVYGGGGTFNLIPTDSITNFTLYDGNTTFNSGVSVPGTLEIETGSTGTTTTTREPHR